MPGTFDPVWIYHQTARPVHHRALYLPRLRRRTAASGMARLSVPPHVIERVLNHISGSQAGVAGIYNRYGYLPEKRQALETWARCVEGLVRLTPRNIVQFAGSR